LGALYTNTLIHHTLLPLQLHFSLSDPKPFSFSYFHFFNSPLSPHQEQSYSQIPTISFFLSLFIIFYPSPLAPLVIIATRLFFFAGSLLNSLD